MSVTFATGAGRARPRASLGGHGTGRLLIAEPGQLDWRKIVTGMPAGRAGAAVWVAPGERSRMNATHSIDFIEDLRPPQVDLLGWTLSGTVAQHVTPGGST